MRKAVVLFMALFVFAGLSAQASMPAYWEPAKALFPYDKKLSALQTDLLDLLDKLNCDDATECIVSFRGTCVNFRTSFQEAHEGFGTSRLSKTAEIQRLACAWSCAPAMTVGLTTGMAGREDHLLNTERENPGKDR